MEWIVHKKQVISIIIRRKWKTTGIHFITPNDFPQQIAYMNWSKGHHIDAHIHNLVKRELKQTQEVLFVRKGKIRVDLYDCNRNYLESRILKKGDLIVLCSGGHGIEMLKRSEIIEVKQGPYLGGRDKERFNKVSKEEIHYGK